MIKYQNEILIWDPVCKVHCILCDFNFNIPVFRLILTKCFSSSFIRLIATTSSYCIWIFECTSISTYCYKEFLMQWCNSYHKWACYRNNRGNTQMIATGIIDEILKWLKHLEWMSKTILQNDRIYKVNFSV